MSGNSTSIAFRIPQADREALDRLATERGVNRSDLFREAVLRVIAEDADRAADLPTANGTALAGPSVEQGLVAVRDLPDAAHRPGAFPPDTLVLILQAIAAELGPTLEALLTMARTAWDALVALVKAGVEAIAAAVAGRDATPDRREPAAA